MGHPSARGPADLAALFRRIIAVYRRAQVADGWHIEAQVRWPSLSPRDIWTVYFESLERRPMLLICHGLCLAPFSPLGYLLG